jgi:hypothetical protein
MNGVEYTLNLLELFVPFIVFGLFIGAFFAVVFAAIKVGMKLAPYIIIGGLILYLTYNPIG